MANQKDKQEVNWVAIRMLTGDRVKFIGLVFGVAFSTLLITQQLTIFVNLLMRGGVAVQEVSTANVWVMDPATRTADVIYPMPITALDRVRSVSGVAFASPLLRSNASIRTPEGDLEGVTVIGVDDSSLVGIPRRMFEGDPARLMDPDAVFIDDVGSRKLFAPGQTVIGSQLELNDQRAIIKGIVDSTPTFTAQVTLYTRYSNALNFVPGTRNRLSFVLVRSDANVSPETLAGRITEQTGLKARTTQQFTRDGIDFIIENTGIPINFGITVVLGVIVGVAIVGLTFSLFIRDNIKQFGALKAIGVTNRKIMVMVAAQSGLVALIGYGLGLTMAAGFIGGGAAGSDDFKGFYMPNQIPLITAALVLAIIALTGFIAIRSVLKTDPASVFR
ncbi:MAG TPA: ABC transporter permease [Sphingorhabdus lacus]|jgi:putative ABC transport system permease protein|nr:ABC transporter permease [Sphingorhabdus lacus]HPV67336.1 ABC transporter permease [Sphingorhabdus lacus]